MSKNKPRKNRRNSNGKGSINYLEPSNRWCASVMHGYKDNDKKKPNRISFYGKTEDEAEEKLRAFLENPEAFKKKVKKDEPELELANDFFRRYLKIRRNSIKDSSWDRLECAFRVNIAPHLEDLQLSQIKPKHIEKIQNAANENGLSLSSIKKIYEVLRPAFKLAVKEKLKTENPFEETILLKKKDVKKKTKKIEICSESQLEILLQTVNSFYNDTSSITYKYFSAVSFMIYTGLRIGEVLALKWEDLIEYEDGTFAIRVDENLVRSAVRDENLELTGKRQSIPGPTKTEAGTRNVPLHPKALNAISQIKETNKLYNITSEFILATPENGHCTIGRIQKSLTNLIKLSGIGTNYGCHSFRHLFCSRLAHNGAKIVEIAELAGQSDLRTTARYMHSTELRKRNAINTLI